MSHRSQMAFVSLLKRRYPSFFDGVAVLEVGSLNINGTVRQFFVDTHPYIGIDVGPGPCVDEVVSGHEYDTDQRFDVAISCNCFEHNPYWDFTFANMVRLTRPGGMIIVTCAGPGFPEHGTPVRDPASSPLTVAKGWTYYKNLGTKEFNARVHDTLVHLSEHMTIDIPRHDEPGNDLFFVGFKKAAFDETLSEILDNAQGYIQSFDTKATRALR